MKEKNDILPLDFEKPLIALSRQITELEQKAFNNGNKKIVKDIKDEYLKVKAQIYKDLSPLDRVKIARHPQRPYPIDYIQFISSRWFELHGDRNGKDDGAIVGGLAEIDGQVAVIVATQKGRNLNENKKRNFGMPSPEGYSKALRLFYHAEKFRFPIITFIDTPGAYPGLEAEAKNQSHAIALNLREMSGLTVPVISVVTGEGGSGGALAIGVANRILMLENSIYSVISPEGCAAILWRTKDKAGEAANSLKITAHDLYELKIVDEVIPEPEGGAHYNPKETSDNLLSAIKRHLDELGKLTGEEIKKDRQEKLRNIGTYLVN